MNQAMNIGERMIGKGQPVFVIAEAGVNHNGDFDVAMQMVDEAAKTGADCIKFQTFKIENIETRHSLKPSYFKDRDGGMDKIEYLKSLELTTDEFAAIKERCKEQKIEFLSTVSELGGLNMLLSFGVDAIKIGSTDTINLPLLKTVAETKLPIILSTGISQIDDIDVSVNVLKEAGCTELAILQCTSEYPCPADELNLRVIPKYIERYQVPIGFSDHSQGNYAAVAAVSLGAMIIEKHFTLDKKMYGVDQAASSTPGEMKEMVKLIRLTEEALGDGKKKIQPNEEEHLITMRKSIVAARPLKRGEILEAKDLVSKRPGGGILPLQMDKVIGCRLNSDLAKDDFLKWEMLVQE